MRKFVISDIHGCSKTLDALLFKLKFGRDDVMFVLGDLINKGSDSKGVLDIIIDRTYKGEIIHCLKGNHEAVLLEGKDQGDKHTRFLDIGGYKTFESFGVNNYDELDVKYRFFFENLYDYLITEKHILVHAGLNFNIENPLDDTYAMHWSRYWYEEINYHWLKGRYIVHGHTPIPKTRIDSQLKSILDLRVMNIDNGCFTNEKGMGNLCALELTTMKVIFQKNIGGI
jgi:serine/threonine protein phosphatase 1